MCEPHHSIVQFPANDPTTGDDNTNRLQWGLGKVYDWAKKIGGYFHFSKLGSGHTESIEWARTKDLILPIGETRLEANWWDRTVHFDGPRTTDEALGTATQYAQMLVIGDIQRLRRFLETSMDKSTRAHLYIQMFCDRMLNYQGKDEFTRKINSVYRGSQSGLIRNPEAAKKIVLGFTRKRKLLIPEWADNPSLWPTG